MLFQLFLWLLFTFNDNKQVGDVGWKPACLYSIACFSEKGKAIVTVEMVLDINILGLSLGNGVGVADGAGCRSIIPAIRGKGYYYLVRLYMLE